MTPTSSDRARRPDAAFRRAFGAVVVVLLVLTAALLAAGALRGPQLDDARFDRVAATERAGEQLRLFFDRAVGDVDGVTASIEPEVPVTLGVQGDLVTLGFDAALAYGTPYTVRLDGVVGIGGGAPSSVEYSFTTATPTVAYLDRDPAGDAVVQAPVPGSGVEVLHRAERIQEFARLGDLLAVARIQTDDSSVLELVDPATGGVQSVPLPPGAVVDRLHAAGDGQRLLFTLSVDAGRSPDRLMSLDPGSGVPQPVLGVAGSELVVSGWDPLADARVVALTIGGSLEVADVATGEALPLGQYAEYESVSPDGATVVVADALGPIAVPLGGGEEQRLLASPLEQGGVEPFLGDTLVLPQGAGRLQKVAVPAADQASFDSYLVVDDGATSRPVLQTEGARGSIGAFSVSPNGRVAAVEVVPDVSAESSDGYPRESRDVSVTTYFVELESGAVLRTVPGHDAEW